MKIAGMVGYAGIFLGVFLGVNALISPPFNVSTAVMLGIGALIASWGFKQI